MDETGGGGLPGDVQRVMTAVNVLIGPREDAALREHCTEQGVWKPSDLDYLTELEDSTLTMGPHTGYEP